ncbi:MAG: hypothetical protein RR986_04120 [Longicatena sp.]
MKKFLVSFLIGITCMAIGTTMLIFECKEFEVIDVRASQNLKDADFENHTFMLKEDEQVSLKYDKKVVNRGYGWHVDDTLKDGVIIVSIKDNVEYSIHGNELTIEQNYDEDNDSFNKGMKAFNKILDGLKEHKIYNYENYSNIVFTSNYKTRSKLVIL